MSATTEERSKNYSAVIGIRLDPGEGESNFLAMVVQNYSALDYPVKKDNHIILFSDVGQAENIVRTADNAEPLKSTPPEVELEIYPADAVQVLQTQNEDPFCDILNFLNTAFDLLQGTSFILPEQHHQVLYPLADHLTFTKDVQSFFASNQFERSVAVNGCLWLLGAILSSVIIVH